VDACYFHGRALYASNRFEQSMAALRRALASGFDTWQVHLGLAQALEALARADEAGSEFRKSVGLCAGRDPGPVVSYARYLIRQGRGQEAAPLLEQTLRQFPRSAEAHTHLGRILLDEGRLPAAIQHLEHAVTLSPESSQAHFLLAKAYVQSGRADDARPHFEAAARYEEGSRKDR
jgi:Flp pilus assembly protein TadD